MTGAGHRQEDVHRVARLLELADLLTPWAIRTVSTLRIPELLGDGAMTIQELAASSGTHPEALGKLLRFLIQHELFVEDPCGVFSLGSLGRLLAAEGRLPLRMVLDLDGAQTRFGQAGAGLAHAVRTGEAAYPSVFDRAFWDDLSDNPALGDSFDGLMAASAARWVPRALAEIEWDGVEHVVDIGGGSGALIVGLLQEQPGIRATLVEQPAVAEKARRRFAEAGLAGRTNVCSGSFFGPLPPGADLYVLAQILHDWPDDRAVAILRRCRDAIPTSGRVVLVERVLGQGGDRRAHAEMDLLMMVLFGASERGPEQFAELAAAAGLSLARITPLGHGVSLLELVVSDESVRTDPAIDACPTGVEMTESRPISPPSQKSDQPDDATWRQRVAARQRRQLDGPVAHPVCPDGWRVGPPDYVGIGAQKCGTTWWALLIGAHPGACLAAGKELHYFQHHWNEDFGEAHVRAYHQYFPRPDGTITGEWTPRYMHDPWTPARLRRAAPDARLLVLLRDPVARYLSGVSHYLARHDRIHPRVLLEAIDRGRYATQLRGVKAHFPEDQVLVLQLERCSRSTEEEVARTYRFLDLDPSFRPDGLQRRLYEGQGPRVTLPQDLRAILEATYRAEAKVLVDEWPEIDLQLWPSVA